MCCCGLDHPLWNCFWVTTAFCLTGNSKMCVCGKGRMVGDRGERKGCTSEAEQNCNKTISAMKTPLNWPWPHFFYPPRGIFLSLSRVSLFLNPFINLWWHSFDQAYMTNDSFLMSQTSTAFTLWFRWGFINETRALTARKPALHLLSEMSHFKFENSQM